MTLNYTNYNFDDLVIQIQNDLRRTSAWKDIYRSSTGERMIEFLAAVLNLALFYAERRAEESYLPLAKNRSSVVNIVSVLNYQPKRKTSAVGNLIFSPVTPLAIPKIIFIPKYTECQISSTGVKYLTNVDAAIQKGGTDVTVSAIQGELGSMEVTSSGLASQEYLINSTEVENSADTANPTLRVVVNGVLWTLVQTFLYSDSTSKHYRVINETDGKVSVLFGDDVNGMSPDPGWIIHIQYVKSSGLVGNVNSGTIKTVNDTVYDEDGTVVPVAVDNTSSFLGGDDAEDIEEIRAEAPQVFKTGDRAVTKADFKSILMNFSGVADNNVWGENEVAAAEDPPVDADYDMLNKVNICLVLQDWVPLKPDDDFVDIISAALYAKSMLTVRYNIIEPVFLDVIPVLDIRVATGYSWSQTQVEVEAAIAEQFILGNTTKLGTIVKYSAILAAIHDLAGVSYANMILEIKKNLVADYTSFCDWGIALDALPIKPETVRLFIGTALVPVATDVDGGAGTGTFTAAGVLLGTITYATGVIEITEEGTPLTSIHARYQQADGSEGAGNIIPSFNQIAQLDANIDIASIEMEN